MLPSFPVKISFDIENHPDSKKAWSHPIARKIALLWRPCHVVNQHYWGETLEIGLRLEKVLKEFGGPIRPTPRLLRRYFNTWYSSNYCSNDVLRFLEDAIPYLLGEKEIPYEIDAERDAERPKEE